MIISFAVENWMSFRNRASFSMIASRERQHGERLPRIEKYQARVLPIAAFYGGNASGKTNLCKALHFAQRFVVKGAQPDASIPVEPFRMDAESARQPTRFLFELLIDEAIYEFSFAVTRRAVLEEKLVLVSASTEKTLYDRREGKPHFDKSLAGDHFLDFAFQGTRDNQLFLTNSVSQKVENFRPVRDWFKDVLQVIAPDSKFGPFEQFLNEDHPLYAMMNDMLPRLDTGITRLGGEEIPFENIPAPESLKSQIREELQEGRTIKLMTSPFNDRITVSSKDGKLTAKKLFTFHRKEDGTEIKFEIREESNGSQRVLDLAPAFLELSAQASRKVIIIDELDRSLHTLLTRRLLEEYLAHCSANTRTQLLLTTHDVLLMDQRLLRRDEMWVAERDAAGVSSLFSFSDFKDIRYDKEIRKSYLQGRLGGIPKMPRGKVSTNTTLARDCGGND
ncbi:MAG: ATP-binding protein [Pseudomonadota bacterium]